ncbi:MAG TPA: Mu transposase C-terminal domain-containing protein [Nitrosomonas europaea]|uniref:Mu transposase C-terminal domain-containing protein n=1 Tax=Nitrosomonas europaea TaxID=915 RepID=UPI002C77FEB7|nr:Mu transposase C-terminal domain-containing protein [Nitrosomonas europaea]HUM74818.1 Mu transposase C-terminal domain-containing protein [Nitrosomonas europaea]
MRDRIHLVPGEIVVSRDDHWRIEDLLDTGRVFCVRLRDNYFDILPIPELEPSDHFTTTDVGPPAPTKIERWSGHPSIEATAESKKSDELKQSKLIAEFRSLLRILETPRSKKRELIREHAQRHQCSEKTVYNRLRIVAETQNAESLERSVRADKGQSRISQEVMEIARKCLSKYRFKATPKSIPKILEIVNGECRSANLAEISLRSLYNIEKQTPHKQKLLKQGRKEEARNLYRPRIGHLPDNDYPLAVLQIDHTPAPVCLVDEVERKPIKTPNLSLAIDTYSRMVFGFCITLDPPSALSAGLALAHSFYPKEKYLQKLKIKGEWPCWGFPDVILVDNAADLNGKMMHGARKRYSFTLRDRPIDGPNFGGHIESAFKTFMHEFKSIDGTTFSNPKERAEYDSEGKAILTLNEFERYFAEFIVNHYHLDKHTGKGMNNAVPLTKFKRGVFEGDKFPPTGLPPIPQDELSLRISLMPVEHRTINNAQVKIFTHEYHSNALKLLSDAAKPGQKFEVRYDPRNISVIWVFDPIGDQFIECRFSDLTKNAISLWEDEARRSQSTSDSAQFADARYGSTLRREKIKSEARSKTRHARREEERHRQHKINALVPHSETQKTERVERKAEQPDRAERRKQMLQAINELKSSTDKPDSKK